jgi:hypothetical protein
MNNPAAPKGIPTRQAAGYHQIVSFRNSALAEYPESILRFFTMKSGWGRQNGESRCVSNPNIKINEQIKDKRLFFISLITIFDPTN